MITRTLTDIPPSSVDEVASDFESEGCTTARNQQTDGNFTLVATCPVGTQ